MEKVTSVLNTSYDRMPEGIIWSWKSLNSKNKGLAYEA